jgi:hypothetical protein
MKDGIEPTKTESIVLSILAYAPGMSAEDVIMLAEYIKDGNVDEVGTALTLAFHNEHLGADDE